jgi:hypothetical protein
MSKTPALNDYSDLEKSKSMERRACEVVNRKTRPQNDYLQLNQMHLHSLRIRTDGMTWEASRASSSLWNGPCQRE